MNITMIDTNLNDFNALGKFLSGVPKIEFSGTSKKEEYGWVKEVLNRFDFRHLRKGEKGQVMNMLISWIKKRLNYLIKLT